MPTSRIAAAFAAIAMLLGAAACTRGDDPSSRDEPQSSTSVVQAFDADRPAPAEPIKGAVRGGTVTMLTSNGFEDTSFGPDGADPTGSYVWASFMSAYVTRSLTQYVYDPEQDAMVVVPDIATDIGRPNADFTEWTYTIRDGVRFEDGAPVTAEDVAFGIKRSFDREAFPSGPPYSTEFFLNGDTYSGPYESGTRYPGVVVDGDDVTIKMAKPFPDMPYWGAWPAMGPMPELTGAASAAYWKHPLASGPYMFDKYTPGESLTLVRNPEWDPDTDPGRHAYPDRVIARFGVPTDKIKQTILGASVAGRTSFTPDFVDLDQGAYARARRLGRVATGADACTYLWYLDDRILTDIRVRRAIGLAYPYQAAAAAIGLPRTTVPSQSLLPPWFPGRRDVHSLDTQPGEVDPPAARALVRDARRDGVDPEQFVLRWPYVKDDPAAVARTAVVSAALEQVGFTAEPLALSATRATDLIESRTAPINIRTGGWCADWASGSNYVQRVLQSGGDGNYSYFSEPAVDDAIDAVSTLPIDEQPTAWGRLDEQIMTDYYPLVVIGGRSVGMLHGSQVGGMHIDPPNGPNPTYKDLYVVR